MLTDEGVQPPRWVPMSLHALPNALRVRDHRPTGGHIGGRVLARAQTRKRRFAWRVRGSGLPATR
eukprot:5991679-Pleurochrysis_carterae.AAC.1